MAKWQYAEVFRSSNQFVFIMTASSEGRSRKAITIDRKGDPDDALWRCIAAMGSEGWEPFQIDPGSSGPTSI